MVRSSNDDGGNAYDLNSCCRLMAAETEVQRLWTQLLIVPPPLIYDLNSLRSSQRVPSGRRGVVCPMSGPWQELEWVRPVIVFHAEIAVKRKAKTRITNRENMRHDLPLRGGLQ